MKRAFLFFPENDLALARDLDNYTPPPAAVALRKSGEALPLWYGSPGDSFIATGINAQWLSKIRDTFQIGVDLFDYHPEGLTPAPWGWSKASRRMFAARGFTPDQLPSDSDLSTIRELSHRRTAALISNRLAENPAMTSFKMADSAAELSDLSEIEDFVRTRPDTLLKLPWSSSGRGLIKVDPSTLSQQIPMIQGILKRQHSVMAEQFLDKATDFAMLFNIESGHCTYTGLSLFTTDRLGSYTGNLLAPQNELERTIAHPALPVLRSILPPILEDIIGTAYSGPLGIDMMVLTDGSIAPAVELNLRNTMGHVACSLYSRFIVPGLRGTFRVIPSDGTSTTYTTSDGRLASGTLDLTPPGAFSFRIDVVD